MEKDDVSGAQREGGLWSHTGLSPVNPLLLGKESMLLYFNPVRPLPNTAVHECSGFKGDKLRGARTVTGLS